MSLADLQAEFGGVTVGCDTIYDLTTWEGLDGWDVRSNDQVLPNLWGDQPGGDFVNGRTFVVGVAMLTADAGWVALEDTWLPPSQADPTALSTFTFKAPERPERQLDCRVRRRARPRDGNTEIATGVVQWLFEFAAPDPRLYSTDLTETLATPFVADTTALNLTGGSGTGLAFDLTLSSGADLAFDFTGTASSGSVAMENAGNVDTYPTFTFATTSAMASWHVVNDTTGEEASFAFALVPGYEVVVDMAGVATGSTNPPVTLNGDANYPIWQSPRVPIRLVPGDNTLRFFVDSGTASGSTCTISHRSAWL